MSDAKEGIVLDKDGKPLTQGPVNQDNPNAFDPHKKFSENFRLRFGGNAMRMTAGSFPGKIILGAFALVMLAVGAVIIFLSVFVFLIRLIFRALFGRGQRR